MEYSSQISRRLDSMIERVMGGKETVQCDTKKERGHNKNGDLDIHKNLIDHRMNPLFHRRDEWLRACFSCQRVFMLAWWISLSPMSRKTKTRSKGGLLSQCWKQKDRQTKPSSSWQFYTASNSCLSSMTGGTRGASTWVRKGWLWWPSTLDCRRT